ncbi:MAG: hypothetical protein Aurels2KO_47920 [Aureliella sp.]
MIPVRTLLHLTICIFVVLVGRHDAVAQEDDSSARVSTSLDGNGTGSIVVEARGKLPPAPVFFTASVSATAYISDTQIVQAADVAIEVLQGKTRSVLFGLLGEGDVVDVTGDSLEAWSVKVQEGRRYLELTFDHNIHKQTAKVSLHSAPYTIPRTVELTHLAKGDAVGFASELLVAYDSGVQGNVVTADGFSPIIQKSAGERFATTAGGKLTIELNHDGTRVEPVELSEVKLDGKMSNDGASVDFRLRATAKVNEADAVLNLLSGAAALSEMPSNRNYRVQLSAENDTPVYQLAFPRPGAYEIDLQFVARVSTSDVGWKQTDFRISASAVVPLDIRGLGSEIEFHDDSSTVIPVAANDRWSGFLPSSGEAKLVWKQTRAAGEGDLFFSSTATLEAELGSGLLRQDHHLRFQVLQGELRTLLLELRGPGEVLDVAGDNVVGWKVIEKGGVRQLDVKLSQAAVGQSELHVRSQTTLDAFPIEVEGLAIVPLGAIRHSGFLRVTNRGAVRVEPTGLSGLSQLSPEQFPGDGKEARQVFVYRFPSASYGFSITADRIQPEVSVSQLLVYSLSDTLRRLSADIELDVREAPVREWDFAVPADYSIVSVTGASISDYIAGTATTDGMRNLKVVFSKDVSGRQLVSVLLEKNVAAEAGTWALPRCEFPSAKAVTGHVGVAAAAGLRVAVESAELLSEKPLSYFPKRPPNLQQAFRIREADWSAQMRVELLQRSTQADVFHLYSLSRGVVYGSSLVNYFITGAPLSELRISVPQELGNVMVDGQDVRSWRREDDVLVVTLHQPVMGAYTLLVTSEERPDAGLFQAGRVAPLDVQGERGYIQVVSPMQVALEALSVPEDILVLDPLELPAEFRLLSTAPSLGTWQYTQRPLVMNLKVDWFQPGTTAVQVVEYCEANSRVSQDGEQVTDILYDVKSRGQQVLRLKLPDAPVRLWSAVVDGQPVTARQAGDETLIPLPSGSDPNNSVEVSVRLGKPAVEGEQPTLALPVVFASVLKTQWNITGDKQRIILPGAGTVTPPSPVKRPSGIEWISQFGLGPLLGIALLSIFAAWSAPKTSLLRVVGALSSVASVIIAVVAMVQALAFVGPPAPLQLSLPVLAAGELVELSVQPASPWQAYCSPAGVVAGFAGVLLLVFSLRQSMSGSAIHLRWIGLISIAAGVLLQGDSAACFWGILAVAIVIFQSIPLIRAMDVGNAPKETTSGPKSDNDGSPSIVTPLLLFIVLSSLCLGSSRNASAEPIAAGSAGFSVADSVTQTWEISSASKRLTAEGLIKVTGSPGERFVLLHAPATLTKFDSKALRLTKLEQADGEPVYVIVIPDQDSERPTATEDEEPSDDETNSEGDSDSTRSATATYEASFAYQIDRVDASNGVAVLTGPAAVRNIDVQYDQAGWDVTSKSAVRVEARDDSASTRANVLLGPTSDTISLSPRVRDLAGEETQFYVEGSHLYVPSPGVVDGVHRLEIRPAQGQVGAVTVQVPSGLMVSSVDGPVGSWQFDASKGELKLAIEPAQAQKFVVSVRTQRGLDTLPAAVSLKPLQVTEATGEVGLIAVAFGPDAQPESVEAATLSAVNLSDFDAGLVPDGVAVHRVYRYGEKPGDLNMKVVPVEPEVRVASKQVLSIGEERVVLNVNFAAAISRAGMFQLSFPLPAGMEVESLSGAALDHWSEITEDVTGEQTDSPRRVVMHFSGKTLGTQPFSLVLVGTRPNTDADWNIPRFSINESTRQTGDLVIQPATGFRVQAASRSNVSETDPRSLGATGRGALAFRLLQSDWSLNLNIEQLDPWITGRTLHEVTLREGQTRSLVLAEFSVENASIGSMQIALPITDPEELKTLRATGDIVSDIVQGSEDSNLWTVTFKRRVVGSLSFRIEYERRGERVNDSEELSPIGFPETRQMSYFFAVRSGGRLEVRRGALSQGWQDADWNAVPQTLRDAGDASAPALVLRAVAPPNVLSVQATRHSLADALKLRVASGQLTTVLSPTGDQLTAVDLKMEIVQRSSLSVSLPADGELFSIFVNGESVHSVKQDDRWQFYILPGLDDKTADVRFVYSVAGDSLAQSQLTGPSMNVPLENIQWNVVAPKGFELTSSDGNLELVGSTIKENYDRKSYLSKASGKRAVLKKDATKLLQQANQLLQAGEQTKARRALSSVANRYALNAAANEDARVQLETLQTQQAVVGLNTRRQRIFLDNGSVAATGFNDQIRQAASDNPLLRDNQLKFRPQQLSQLLGGNSREDNEVLQRIAARLVQHQRTTEPAPQAIILSLPEEGSLYEFRRSVQVAEGAPLELKLDFGRTHRMMKWQTLVLGLILAVIACAFTVGSRRLSSNAR